MYVYMYVYVHVHVCVHVHARVVIDTYMCKTCTHEGCEKLMLILSFLVI